jgi:hypothetical protein
MVAVVPVVLISENNKNKNNIVTNPDKKITNVTGIIFFSYI